MLAEQQFLDIVIWDLLSLGIHVGIINEVTQNKSAFYEPKNYRPNETFLL